MQATYRAGSLLASNLSKRSIIHIEALRNRLRKEGKWSASPKYDFSFGLAHAQAAYESQEKLKAVASQKLQAYVEPILQQLGWEVDLQFTKIRDRNIGNNPLYIDNLDLIGAPIRAVPSYF